MPEDENEPYLKVLLDQNVPQVVGVWLQGLKSSWEVNHVSLIGLEGSNDSDIFEWAQENGHIIITFDENSGVYFETNKYNINDPSKETLNKLAGIFVEYADTKVLVVGHTDSVGADEYNMTLSKNRTYAVTNYFIHNRGLSSLRFTTNWFGEQQPMHDNGTAEGRAKNRRVNIVILPNDKMKADAKKEAGN